MRKCKGVGELAVVEASRVAGVRTRSRTLALAAAAASAGGTSSKRRKTARPGELRMSCLQLRSRSLATTPRISGSLADSAAGRRSSSVRGRICRCSGNGSSEAVEKEQQARFVGSEGGDDLETEMRETLSSSSQREESSDLESTADRKLRRSSPEAMPSAAEIEEFFGAAEREMKRRFAEKYNFDVDRDVPLDGRFEWVQLKP